MAAFSERLSILLESSNKTKKEIAEFLGMTPRNLRYYELGENQPTPDMIIKLSDLFGVSIGYLLGIEDEPKMIAPNPLMRVLTPADANLLDWIYNDPEGIKLMTELDESEAKRLMKVWKVLREVRDEH